MCPIESPAKALRSVRSERGFSLIEVLVSALIVILVASATATALITGAHFSGDQRFRSQADTLAVQDQERLKGLSDEQLSGVNQTRTVTLPSGTYTIRSVSQSINTTGVSSCTSTGVAYYKIASTVTWTENFSRRPATVTEDSLLARPVNGDLMAQVQDQTLTPLQDVTVTATGPSTQTGTTDANGCVVFAGLTPGSYSVGLTDQTDVDPSGNYPPYTTGGTTSTATATVTSTGTAAPTGNVFHLGQPGSVAGTFTTAMSGVSGEADTVSWLGSGATFGMSNGFQSTTPLSAPATAITTKSLFPFDVSSTSPASYNNNYTVWAGRCLQNEPPSGYNQVSVTPGSTGQAHNVQEPTLDVATVNYAVTVTHHHGSPTITTTAVKPTHVRLTFASTAGAACTSYTWSPTIASGTTEPSTGWLANPGQPFASTATSGATASAASSTGSPQTGTLSICADYYDPTAGASYMGTLTSVTNTNFTTTPTPLTITISNPANPGTCP